MLNKVDLKAIEGIIERTVERTVERVVDKKIKDNLSEFFQHILAPYLDHEHGEIMQRFDENDKDHEKIFRVLDKNRNEHDQIFVKLDIHERKIKNHDNRIKKLETLTAS